MSSFFRCWRSSLRLGLVEVVQWLSLQSSAKNCICLSSSLFTHRYSYLLGLAGSGSIFGTRWAITTLDFAQHVPVMILKMRCIVPSISRREYAGAYHQSGTLDPGYGLRFAAFFRDNLPTDGYRSDEVDIGSDAAARCIQVFFLGTEAYPHAAAIGL